MLSILLLSFLASPLSSEWIVNGVQVSTAGTRQYGPQTAPDRYGGAIIAWDDNDAIQSVIKAQRMDTDCIRQWNTAGITVSSLDCGSLVLVSDNAGGAIIAWTSFGTDSDILAQRVDAGGTVQWAANRDGVVVGPEMLEVNHKETEALRKKR